MNARAGNKRKDLKPTHNLKAIFRSIRNHLAANTIGTTRDEALVQQLINLLFCKLFDERNTPPDQKVKFRTGPGGSGQETAHRIKDLFLAVKAVQTDVFSEEDAISLDDNSIYYVVDKLQHFSLIDSERDVVADAFETFIGHGLKGEQGQFFTPRNVVRMIVDILDPGETDKIIDPACGSGGFLMESLKHVWSKAERKYSKQKRSEAAIEKRKREIATSNIRGIEKDTFLSKVTKAYLNLVADGAMGVFCEDTLESPLNWSPETQSKVTKDGFDILITNPPFGSKIPVIGAAKIKQFDLGYKWQFDQTSGKWIKTDKLKTREEPQVLFIERCLDLLKDGGKMAIVLTSGILGNYRERYLREYILERGNLLAIVELPFETFCPHVTINTSVLFIQKGKKNQNSDLFISIVEHCGNDKKGRPTPQDDIPLVADFYKSKRSDHNHFFIDPARLEHSFIAKRYLQKYVDNIQEIKKSKHPVVTLDTLIRTIHNGANIDDASNYVDQAEGLPYILVKSITKEGINFENLKYIRKDLAKNKNVIKNTVSEKVILMTRAGNSGIASNIPPDLKNAVASGFLINLHVDLDKVNQYYLVAYLNSKYGQLQLERISSGSILQSIRSSELKKVLIILPPKELQDQIGEKVKAAVYAKAETRQKIKSADDDIAQLMK